MFASGRVKFGYVGGILSIFCNGGENSSAWFDVVSPKKGSSVNNSCIGPLSEIPISKATLSELFDSIASTPPLANLPIQQPRPFVNSISGKKSSESSNVALSLLFDTKKCGIEEDFEHMAIVIDSCSLCGREKDGVDGRLRVLKEVTLLTVSVCVVCE